MKENFEKNSLSGLSTGFPFTTMLQKQSSLSGNPATKLVIKTPLGDLSGRLELTRTQEATAFRDISNLEVQVKELVEEIPDKVRDVIYFNGEVRRMKERGAAVKRNDFIDHCLLKFKQELARTVEFKERNLEFLNTKIRQLQAENLEITTKILESQEKLLDLERQFGAKRKTVKKTQSI